MEFHHLRDILETIDGKEVLNEQAWAALETDEQKNLFDELFIYCLQECEKQSMPFVDSRFHKHLKIVLLQHIEIPDTEGSKKTPPAVPIKLLRNILETVVESSTIKMDQVLSHAIEILISYILLIFGTSSEYVLKTKSCTYTSTTIIADVSTFFERLMKLLFNSKWKNHPIQRNLVDACMTILSHAEQMTMTGPASEILQSAVVGLGESQISGNKKTAVIDSSDRRKMLDVALGLFKKFIPYPSWWKVCEILLIFVGELSKTITDETLYKTAFNSVSDCFQVALENDGLTSSLALVFLRMLSHWNDMPDSEEDKVVEAVQKFWRLLDKQMVIIEEDVDEMEITGKTRTKLLKTAAEQLNNIETLGPALHMLIWDCYGLQNKWLNHLEPDKIFSFVAHYLLQNSPEHESMERFRYHQKLCVQLLCRVMCSWAAEDVEDDLEAVIGEQPVHRAYHALASAIGASDLMPLVLAEWQEPPFPKWHGCKHLDIIKLLSNHLVVSFWRVYISGGTLQLRKKVNNSFLRGPKLYDFYMRRLKKLDKAEFYKLAWTQMKLMANFLSVLCGADQYVPVLTAAVSLKYLAAKTVASQPAAMKQLEAFPDLTDYIASVQKQREKTQRKLFRLVTGSMAYLLQLARGHPLNIDNEFLTNLIRVLSHLSLKSVAISQAAFLVVEMCLALEDRHQHNWLQITWPVMKKAIEMEDRSKLQAFINSDLFTLLDYWQTEFAELPWIECFMETFKKPNSHKDLIVRSLHKFAEVLPSLDELRERYMEALPTIMGNSLKSKRLQRGFRDYLDLFQTIFENQQEQFFKMVSCKKEDARSLFATLMTNHSFSKRVRAISSTLGIAFNHKRKRGEWGAPVWTSDEDLWPSDEREE